MGVMSIIGNLLFLHHVTHLHYLPEWKLVCDGRYWQYEGLGSGTVGSGPSPTPPSLSQ